MTFEVDGLDVNVWLGWVVRLDPVQNACRQNSDESCSELLAKGYVSFRYLIAKVNECA